LNDGSIVSGDLLVPGKPTVRLNGHPVLGGIVDSLGAATPTNNIITLNGDAMLGHVVRRVDAIALPIVAAPPQPTGTRNVTLSSSTQSPGDFATLRNLNLNSNVGLVAVPPGTYGSFSANNQSGFVLGVTGATEPVLYQFQSLTLNSNATLKVVGPVIVVLKDGLSTGVTMGSAEHPAWLELRIANGGLTLSNSVAVHATVLAPAGTVTLNGNVILKGRVASDRLTINDNGLLEEVPPQD
jgi:rhamnogalacturonan endolyase